MKTIKVLVIGISGIYGGVEKSVLGIVGRCNDIDFEFLCFGKETPFRREHLAGRIVYYIPNRKDNVRLSNKKQKEFWKKHGGQYDVVWINTGSASNITSHAFAKLYSQATIITHSHSSRIECDNRLLRVLHTARHRMNQKRMNDLTDIRLACSEKAAIHLFGKHYTAIILNNSIDLNDYIFCGNDRKNIREQYDIKDDEQLLIMVGRLEHVKNPEYALKVLKSMITINPSTTLLFVGDGGLMDDIKSKAKEMGISNKIVFTGFQLDVKRYMSAADCLLLPSYFEGFPMTLIEAQANSLPCVVSNQVTNEAKLTDIVIYNSIDDDNIDDWIKAIIRLSDYDRNNNIDINLLKEYDLNYTCGKFRRLLEGTKKNEER